MPYLDLGKPFAKLEKLPFSTVGDLGKQNRGFYSKFGSLADLGKPWQQGDHDLGSLAYILICQAAEVGHAEHSKTAKNPLISLRVCFIGAAHSLANGLGTGNSSFLTLSIDSPTCLITAKQRFFRRANT